MAPTVQNEGVILGDVFVINHREHGRHPCHTAIFKTYPASEMAVFDNVTLGTMLNNIMSIALSNFSSK